VTRRGSSRRLLLAALAVVLGAAQAGTATAAELTVAGRVLSVTPLVSPSSPDCTPAPPAAGAGLADWLAWDLNTACTSTEPSRGYRVRYEWDGREYERIMDRRPGTTVPLRVTLQ